MLFVTDADRAALGSRDFLWRKDCQFHWHNRDYASFDDFLATFRSEKRKKALRERRRVAGERHRRSARCTGEEIDARLWDIVFGFSAGTFAVRGHEHYLNAEFFRAVSAALPGAVVVKLAEYRGHADRRRDLLPRRRHAVRPLLGRGGGVSQPAFRDLLLPGHRVLHRARPARFEPGTQGEHKVPRGFEPTQTWSAHWIADPRFRRAIDSYLDQERDGRGRIHAAGAGARARSDGVRLRLDPQDHVRLDRLAPERDSPDAFPPVDRALREPDGLLAAGGDLTPPRLLAAYRRGIFPWYSRGQPILWWCPDPRAVLFPGELRVSRSLAKSMRKRGYDTRLEHGVPRRDPRLRQQRAAARRHLAVAGNARGLSQLHRLGFAHSVETWAGRAAGRRAVRRGARARCSSASPCSAASAMPRRSRSSGCATSCWRAASA